MNYSGIILLLVILLLTTGCTDEDLNPAVTPVHPGTATAMPVTTAPAGIPGQDPVIGVWRITNSQGYDDRYRFNADGTFAESFCQALSASTQIHSGTWSAEGADTYTLRDTTTGKSATWVYDPAKRTIHSVAVAHLLLTPYAGDIAAGVAFTTVIPSKTTEVPTTAIPASGPAIPSPVNLSGIGSKMVSFEAKHPGDVKFRIYYNISAGEDPECVDDVARFRLSGPTIDTVLYYGRVDALHDSDHTFRLPAPGRYSLTVQGCWGWYILVDNA
jgi:hypothetical protein